ncbi:MAG: penicillin-binding protein 1C [Candidatus Auribacterota bacterium]|nr:penicillin-binding protein 1C [Candidatus Auribacterota bacterium]
MVSGGPGAPTPHCLLPTPYSPFDVQLFMKIKPYKIIILLSLTIATPLSIILLFHLLPFDTGAMKRYHASRVIYNRDGGVLRVTLGEGDNICRPIGLEGTGDWAVKAALAAEDKRFFQHPGVDPIAIIRAIGQNISSGRIVSGASTISTLVVKLTGPRRGRNIFTKLIEAFRSLQMEGELDKDEILTQYLNRAPFGSNLVGIAVAARRYFGKSARDLTLAEAALLLGLPQAPSRLRPDWHPGAAGRRKMTILDRMFRDGLISEEELKASSNKTPLPSPRPLPFRAPHFCDLVLKQAGPEDRESRTTLDPALQSMAEEILARDADERGLLGISGGAVVIIHVPTGEVRALVGSPDYFDPTSGQVNCAAARRSPGSTLKPFIYGHALDRGLCGPDTILFDIPVGWRGYRPENYDREFRGPVTVREALNQSLNIPAISLARKISIPDLLRLFRSAGMGTLDRSAGDYGVGIAIGDGEVTLLDLTNSYACLARGGEYLPYRILESTNKVNGRDLISSEAAYLITDILEGPGGLWSRIDNPNDLSSPLYAGKTGTSNGYRDAWALGYNPEYAVGIWLGNPDGRSSPSLIGFEVAAPLLNDIFRRIYPRGDSPRFDPPEGLKKREVCSITGLSPNHNCPARRMGYYIPGITPSETCRVHKYDGSKVVESWPPALADFLESKSLNSRSVLAKHKEVELNHRTRLKIKSPLDGESFLRITGGGSFRQMIPLKASGGDGGDIYWFVNGVSIGRTRSGEEIFWELKEGIANIACSDIQDNTDTVKIGVKSTLCSFNMINLF